MKKNDTNVSCSVTNCVYEKEGKCSLSKIEIHSIGRGDLCNDPSSTLCDSFQSRGNTFNYNYEFANESIEKFPDKFNKKEAMVME